MQTQENELLNEKINIIKSIGEVCGEENLASLLSNKPNIIAYDGFEPSNLTGKIHIAQGILRAHNVNKFVSIGVHFKFWVADWFAKMNLKLGGDMNKIHQAGENMIKMWKACGMDTDILDQNGKPMIEFIWSSEEINKRSDEYWRLVLDISTKFPLSRIKRCTQIMGRKSDANLIDNLIELNTEITQLEGSTPIFQEKKQHILETLKNIIESNQTELMSSQILYPIMQCADIFFLNVDICSLGVDQKKVNMLAIEYCDKIKRKLKPIIVSHHMLMGLDGSDKMSKSNPDNTIFMDDTPIDIKRKIRKSFCEPNNIIKNPLLDWIEHLILPINKNINIKTKNDQDLEDIINYTSIDEIKQNFASGKIHPVALKETMCDVLITMLTPIQARYQELIK